jgi:sodium/potassium-transporting ATPase subunit alpha
VELNTSYERGLNKEQVAVAQVRYGKNSLPTPKERPLWIKFVLSFFSGFAPLLWVSTLFVFLSWEPFGTPPSNIYNLALAIVLLIVIFISGMFSFYQEVTTSQVLGAFSKILPTECTVIRDGTQSVIDM